MRELVSPGGSPGRRGGGFIFRILGGRVRLTVDIDRFILYRFPSAALFRRATRFDGRPVVPSSPLLAVLVGCLMSAASSFQLSANRALESFVEAVQIGESGAVWNKVLRGEYLYAYSWAMCRDDEDFSKANWDKHVGVALAYARTKREMVDTNAKRWVYWFSLTSLGMDVGKLSLQSGSVLKALERLVEFQGVDEPGEGETLPSTMDAGPVFSWFDAKAEAVCRKVLDRKTPLTGEQAVKMVNASFPDRIKVKAAASVDDDAEGSSKSSKSSTTVESESTEPGAMNLAALNSGSLAGLVRSWFAQASTDERALALRSLGEVMAPYLAEAKRLNQAAKAQAAGGGIGSVAPQSVAAGAA